MSRLVVILFLGLLGGGGWWAFGAMESTPPQIDTASSVAYVGAQHGQEVTVFDRGRGVESVSAWVEAGDARFEILSNSFKGGWMSGAAVKGPRQVQVTIVPSELKLPEGQATLVIEAADFSWRRNLAQARVPLVVDSRSPRVSTQTGLTYVRQRGTEAVVYEIDEPTVQHGVEVGPYFFGGFVHPYRPSQMIAFYALPHDVPKDARPTLIATDRAGNRTAVPLSVSVIQAVPSADRIQLSDGFMSRKVAELLGGEQTSALDGYLKLNREMRTDNDATIKKVCATSSEEPLWSGPFLQLPNSQVRASFAEARTYVYNGQEVDKQTHLGFDLASNAMSPVPAANDGVVVFSDDLGIYGKTVIIDHGLSLFSLYGHLSSIQSAKGQAVARGETVGLSGATGLAGGDHLHFSMMLGGVFIDPLEWFDAKWIRDHLSEKLGNGRKPGDAPSQSTGAEGSPAEVPADAAPSSDAAGR